MLTYSINVGTPTETSSLENINDVLNQLPDNTSQLLSPKDVRDAVYTAWTTNVFKPTTVTASSVEYVGLDSSETGINLKEKIYLGKRRLSGLDIMDDTLLNSDSDIFIFNTKSDSSSQDSTKVSVLAGDDATKYNLAPYFESSYISGSSSIDFNIVNPNGNVNIYSSASNVSINGLIFPTRAESASASNGYVLKYLDNAGDIYLDWQPLGSANIDTIYSSATVSITGNPVLINGNNIEFTNSSPILSELGGISLGSTFSNVALVTLLNTLLYPYVDPVVSMILTATSSISYGVTGIGSRNVIAESGALSSVRYIYNITNKSIPITSVLASPGGSLPPTTTRLSGTSSISIPSSTQLYTLTVSDGTGTVSSTASLTYVYPYFYGVTSNSINFGSNGVLSSLNKVISEKSDISVTLTGTSSHIYFLYPNSYGDLTSAIDNITGWNYISSFSKIHSGISLTSSSPYWSASYSVYSYTAGSGVTTVNSMWTFKH